MENGEGVKLRQSFVFTISCLTPSLGLPTDIMCNNQTYQLMMDRLNKARTGIKTHIIIDNVGKLVRAEAENIERNREKKKKDGQSFSMSWDTYHRSVGFLISKLFTELLSLLGGWYRAS